MYGSGTANVTDQFISTNQFGYSIDKISVSGLNLNTGSGTFYLNLQNAVIPNGDPVYWDENSGSGCHSTGCPSQAYQNAVGTIPSEAFEVIGSINNHRLLRLPAHLLWVVGKSPDHPRLHRQRRSENTRQA